MLICKQVSDINCSAKMSLLLLSMVKCSSFFKTLFHRTLLQVFCEAPDVPPPVSLASSDALWLLPISSWCCACPISPSWDWEFLEGSDCIESISVFQLPAQSTGRSGWMKNFNILCEIANYSHPWKKAKYNYIHIV